MKRILTFILCALPLLSFADWTKGEDLNKDTYVSKEFVIPSKKCSKGFEIAGFDTSNSDFVKLRFDAGKVDCIVWLFEDVSNNPVNVYINLLDDDGYIVKSVFVGGIVSNYKGELYTSFKCDWNLFKQVKRYSLSIYKI